jgi:tetratricopeptide (TPR) repeat protein
MTIAQAAGEQRSRMLATAFLSSIAVRTGEFHEAKLLLDEALTICTDLGDRLATALTLRQLGKYRLALGESDAALQDFERSLIHLRAAGVDYPSEALEWIAATHCARGELETAEQIARQGLQLAQERGIQRRIFNCLSVLGRIAHARHEYAQAVELQMQALGYCQNVGHEPDTAAIVCYLAQSETACGPAYQAAARHHYQEALQLAFKHRLAPVALECLVGTAELLRDINEEAEAAELLHLVVAHPSATHEARQWARQLLAEDTLAAHIAGDNALAWQSAAQHALTLLARPDWGKPRQLTRNFPTKLSPFVGRQQEIADISQNLLNPGCRLLTLVGLGGIGKTRLAIQVAQHLAEHAGAQKLFADGIVFVPLAAVNDVDALALAIAEALDLDSYGLVPVREQLLDALANQRLLLILDNFEQVAAGATLLGEMLAAAPALKLLVTSRVVLELAEAWFYPVGGMSFPTDRSTQPMESFESVQLFIQCARRVRANLQQDCA